MGIFWELIQQSQLEEQHERASSLEDRVEDLEKELSQTQALLKKTLEVLEEHVGKDIAGDGIAG